MESSQPINQTLVDSEVSSASQPRQVVGQKKNHIYKIIVLGDCS